MESGRHTAEINAIAAPADCSFLASGSSDKTLRLWAFGDTRSLDVLRPTIGDENFGKVFAVAVAPKGDLIAFGGWTLDQGRHFVFVVDRASRKVTARFGPLQTIQSLAFSADGQHLAAGTANGGGVSVWRRNGSGWKRVLERKAPLRIDTRAVTFGPDGELYAAGSDGTIARHPSDFSKQPKIVRSIGGREPKSLAIGPSRKLAVGFLDRARVDVLDQQLSLLYHFDGAAHGNGSLSAVAWTVDGSRLLAAGTGLGGGKAQLNIVEKAGEGAARAVPASSDTITALLGCPQGTVVAATDPLLGFYAPNGDVRSELGAMGPDMRGKVRDGLLVSRDGLRVRFGLDQGAKTPVEFDVKTGVLKPSPNPAGDIEPPRVDGLRVEDWENEKQPRLGVDALGALETYRWSARETSRSLAIDTAQSLFVLGTDLHLRAYHADGRIAWTRRTPGVTWGVNIARDKRVLVAAFSDGTLRWYNLDSGEELFALFVSRSDGRWIIWMPSGHYFCSIDAENLVGWQVNKGWDSLGVFHPLERFREQNYAPARVIRTAIDGTSAQVPGDRGARTDIEETEAKRIGVLTLPRLGLVAPVGGSQFFPPKVDFNISLKEAGSVDRIEVYEGNTRFDSVEVSAAARRAGEIRFSKTFAPRNLSVRLVPSAGPIEGEPIELQLKLAQLAVPDEQRRQRLVGVMVGVDRYRAELLQSLNLKPLRFAARDARSLKAELEQQNGRTFSGVDLELLSNPSLDEVRAALGRLKSKAKETDLVLFSFSGHGVSHENRDLFFLTSSSQDDPWASALQGRELVSKVSAMPGQKLILIDACRAGDAAELFKPVFDMHANDWRTKGGSIYLASTAPGRASYETDAYGGLFTFALIDGLRNAGTFPMGATTRELERHAHQLLANLNVDQSPIRVPSAFDIDFVLARGTR